MKLEDLNERLEELREPSAWQELMRRVPSNAPPSQALASWINIKETILTELGTLAILESGCDDSVWRSSNGAVKRSSHQLHLSVVENRLEAAKLAYEDQIARHNLSITAEGLKLGQQQAELAKLSASVAKRGAWAAGISAGVALVAILLQVAGEYRSKEVSVAIKSPVSLEPLAIDHKAVEAALYVLRAAGPLEESRGVRPEKVAESFSQDERQQEAQVSGGAPRQ